jgi:hypothetical protein
MPKHVKRLSENLAVGALIAATLASLIVLISPARTGYIVPTVAPEPGVIVTQTPPPVTERLIWFGLLDSMGPRILIISAIPVALCALPGVLATRIRNDVVRGASIWVLDVGLWVMGLLFILSYGVLYFPAAVLLLAAAMVNSRGFRATR